MRNSDQKLIILLWTVIIVLAVGSVAGGYVLVHRANSLDKTNSELTGNNDSLQRQLKQIRARLNATPSASPTPAPLPTPPTAATPTPSPTPKTTPKP